MRRKTRKRKQHPIKEDKYRLTIYLPPELAEQVKNAVFWTPGLTIAALAERALAKEVKEMIEERGEPYPTRHGALIRGRPLK